MAESDDQQRPGERPFNREGLNDEQVVAQLAKYFKSIPGEGAKVVALIGGPASGKGTLSARLAEKLGSTAVLASDNYTKGDRVWRHKNVEDVGGDPLTKYDPEYLNSQIRRIQQLKDGEKIGIPIYDQFSGIAISDDPNSAPDEASYIQKGNEVSGRQDFIIVEGDFQFVEPGLLNRMIYLDVDDQTREELRVYRDVKLGKRLEDPDPVVAEKKTRASFQKRQGSQFEPHTLPNKDKADLLVKVHASPLAEPTSETNFEFKYDLVQQNPAA